MEIELAVVVLNIVKITNHYNDIMEEQVQISCQLPCSVNFNQSLWFLCDSQIIKGYFNVEGFIDVGPMFYSAL